MTDELRQSEAQAIIDDVRAHVDPHIVNVQHPDNRFSTDSIILAFPPGASEPIDLTQAVEAHRSAPKTLFGTAVLSDLESFIQHVRAFSKEKPESVLFADANRLAPKLTAIYDYQTSEKPSFARHRARYEFQLSDQWKAWLAVSGKPLGQADFATFLEGHLEDLISPENVGEQTSKLLASLYMRAAKPSEVLELSNGLSLTVSSKVSQKLNSTTGERELSFSDEHKDSGGVTKLEVPKAFVIAIPVFQLGAFFQVPVRIQYRVTEQGIRWAISLLRTENIFDSAFREACSTAQKETDLPLFYGIDEKSTK